MTLSHIFVHCKPPPLSYQDRGLAVFREIISAVMHYGTCKGSRLSMSSNRADNIVINLGHKVSQAPGNFWDHVEWNCGRRWAWCLNKRSWWTDPGRGEIVRAKSRARASVRAELYQQRRSLGPMTTPDDLLSSPRDCNTFKVKKRVFVDKHLFPGPWVTASFCENFKKWNCWLDSHNLIGIE